jgi:hypothetical protein
MEYWGIRIEKVGRGETRESKFKLTTAKFLGFRCQVSGVRINLGFRCQVSGRDEVSGVRCQVSGKNGVSGVS